MPEFWTNGIATLYQTDARQIPIPDQSVHCVVTSPPYFGLRVYRSDSDAMIGLEETVPGWLDSMLEVMAEVGRVLRDDGVLWVNLGDSYGEAGQLLMIPARFALAMQDAGWILRSDVIWAKKSCMPESLNGTRWERCRVKVGNIRGLKTQSYAVGSGRNDGDNCGGIDSQPWAEYTDCPGCPKCADTDGYVLRNGSWRCTSSHEHIFQFVKGMGYYSDGEAVKTVTQIDPRNAGANGTANDTDHNNNPSGHMGTPMNGANRRNVWSDISPEPYGGEHYATFPSDLPRLCIQASTSEAGVCADCGAQWARVVESATGGTLGNGSWYQGQETSESGRNKTTFKDRNDARDYQTGKTLSWGPTCTCNADKVPATVLDPFAGTGTTLLAAMRLGRRSVGVDLSPDYLEQAVKRLGKQSLPMLI